MPLSICIPTWNRAPELRQLLDSIAAQSGDGTDVGAPDVEVVVSDNASTDDTGPLVERHRAAGMNIRYHRFDENQGFDRNVMNAVEIASGEYCWLFGSDDIMEPGALMKVRDALRRHPGVSAVSVGSQGYSPDMARRVHVTDNIATQFKAETMLRGREEPAATIGPWIGYMSALIVRRSLWRAAVASAPVEPFMKGFVHLYLAVKMLDDRSTWLVVPDRLVGNRTGNEQFIPTDEFSRARFDMQEFDRAFAGALGRDNRGYRRAMAMVADYFVRTHFMTAKMRGVGRAYWREALPMSLGMYWRYPVFWAKTAPVALTPRPLLLAARAVHRRVARLRGRA